MGPHSRLVAAPTMPKSRRHGKSWETEEPSRPQFEVLARVPLWTDVQSIRSYMDNVRLSKATRRVYATSSTAVSTVDARPLGVVLA